MPCVPPCLCAKKTKRVKGCKIFYRYTKIELMGKLLRPLCLIGSFAAGLAFPQISVLAPLIPWFIRFMLFALFLGLDFHAVRFYRSHLYILLLNLLIGLVGWKLFMLWDQPVLALAAFFVGITPTGTAAPVVTGFLGRKVEYVATSFMINTLGVAISLIFLIPLVLGQTAPNVFFDVATKIGSVVFLPLILALIFRRFFPVSRTWPKKLKSVVFAAWVCVLAIILSGASDYIRSHREISWRVLFALGFISLFMCALNFVLGYWVGEPSNRREASQSLGQKNTSITIWLAVTFAGPLGPLVALGPTLYVLWHNGWNAIQLEEYARSQKIED